MGKVFDEQWYDMYDDWGLIEASFTSQYGIRLRNQPDMSWSEFSTLLAGIMPETPLGKIVSIRSENDNEILKNFTKEHHKIRNEWRGKRLELTSEKEKEEMINQFQLMMKSAFS